MSFVLVPLIIASFLLFIIGIFKPSVSLFWYKGSRTRIKSFLIYMIIGLIFMVVFGSNLPDNLLQNTQDNSITDNGQLDPKKIDDGISRRDYIEYFNRRWDSIRLTKEDGFPKYELYHTQLDSVANQILSITDVDSTTKVFLKKLRAKYLTSNKYKKASHNYQTYGQPSYEGELFAPCMSAFNTILNDPGSLDIIDRSVKSQSKNGWIIKIVYRAKSGFGANVLQSTTFDVRYDATNHGYYVSNFY